MKYIDSFNSGAKNFITENTSESEIVENTDIIISNNLEQIDLLQSMILMGTDNINQWRNAPDPTIYSKHINTTDIFNRFLIECAHLILLQNDFYVAYKYLNTTCDDWEYRVFARRIYTIMHETGNGFQKVHGESMKYLKGFIDEKDLSRFLNALSNLNKFLNRYDSVFKEVRNACEAHKDPDINRQIGAIESISIEESSKLIKDYACCLTILSITSMDVFQAINKKLSELVI